MRFFKAINELFAATKASKSMAKEMKEQEIRSLSYAAEELAGLSDNDLFWAAMYRTEHRVDGFDRLEEGVDSLNASQKIFYSVNLLETEVNNGGLCQFFVNSSRAVAPFVSEYMGIIGADEHKKLYDTFIAKAGIDLNSLSFFDMDDVSEFEEKAEAYPFEEYDNAFYELEPLETYLTRYVRAHIEDF